jgi:hypothetical protein
MWGALTHIPHKEADVNLASNYPLGRDVIEGTVYFSSLVVAIQTSIGIPENSCEALVY